MKLRCLALLLLTVLAFSLVGCNKQQDDPPAPKVITLPFHITDEQLEDLGMTLEELGAAYQNYKDGKVLWVLVRDYVYFTVKDGSYIARLDLEGEGQERHVKDLHLITNKRDKCTAQQLEQLPDGMTLDAAIKTAGMPDAVTSKGYFVYRIDDTSVIHLVWNEYHNLCDVQLIPQN